MVHQVEHQAFQLPNASFHIGRFGFGGCRGVVALRFASSLYAWLTGASSIAFQFSSATWCAGQLSPGALLACMMLRSSTCCCEGVALVRHIVSS